jgi:hypothetical protein
MELVDLAVDKNVPGVGVAYQRHLSSVAHAKLHGLTRVLTPLAGTPPEARQDIHQCIRGQDRAGTAGRPGLRVEPGRPPQLVHRMEHGPRRQPQDHNAGDLGPYRRSTLPGSQQARLIASARLAERPSLCVRAELANVSCNGMTVL